MYKLGNKILHMHGFSRLFVIWKIH